MSESWYYLFRFRWGCVNAVISGRLKSLKEAVGINRGENINLLREVLAATANYFKSSSKTNGTVA